MFVDILRQQAVLLVVQPRLPARDIGQDDGIVILQRDQIAGEIVDADGGQFDAFLGQRRGKKISALAEALRSHDVVDVEDSALSLDEGESFGGVVLRQRVGRRIK